jgi:hypothetical protein
MAQTAVKRTLAVPAEALWGRLANFGDVSWITPVTRVEVEGSGPGMVRLVYAGGDTAVRERLESLDPERRTLVYTIPANNPLPVEGYRATVRVEDLGQGRCEIEWSCEYQPSGVSPEQAERSIQAMYGVMIDWVSAGLG